MQDGGAALPLHRSVKRRSHSSPLLFTFWPSLIVPTWRRPLLFLPSGKRYDFLYDSLPHYIIDTLGFPQLLTQLRYFCFERRYSGLEWHRSATFCRGRLGLHEEGVILEEFRRSCVIWVFYRRLAKGQSTFQMLPTSRWAQTVSWTGNNTDTSCDSLFLASFILWNGKIGLTGIAPIPPLVSPTFRLICPMRSGGLSKLARYVMLKPLSLNDDMVRSNWCEGMS